MCKLCKTTLKSWTGGDRRCAFVYGIFSGDNWMCATMNRLRKIAKSARVYGDDQSIAVIPVPELGDYNSGWLILNWYKNRGCTDVALFVSYGDVTMLREDHALLIIQSLDNGGETKGE